MNDECTNSFECQDCCRTKVRVKNLLDLVVWFMPNNKTEPTKTYSKAANWYQRFALKMFWPTEKVLAAWSKHGMLQKIISNYAKNKKIK